MHVMKVSYMRLSRLNIILNKCRAEFSKTIYIQLPWIGKNTLNDFY